MPLFAIDEKETKTSVSFPSRRHRLGWAVMRNAVFAALTCIYSAFLLTGCGQLLQQPNATDSWLSYKYSQGGCPFYSNTDPCGLQNTTEADNYYKAIGAENSGGTALFNLEQWKVMYNYPAVAPIAPPRALYGNQLDLQFGRDMNCWYFGPLGQNVACYVTNYGPSPISSSTSCKYPCWPNLAVAVDAAIDQNTPLATVAMVYEPTGIGANHDPVAFFVFDGNGNLSDTAALDTQGGKTVPRMCMACHGGTYNTATHSVEAPATGQLGTSFLPFDVWSFFYSQDIPGYSLDIQQEQFRQLNAIVLATNPSPAIQGLINDLYSNKVTVPGFTIPNDSYVPASWQTADGSAQKIYKGVFRQYCRMCHLAQDTPDFSSYTNFRNEGLPIYALVCTSHDMPQAEIPFSHYWYTSDGTLNYAGFWGDITAITDLNSMLQQQVGTGSGCPIMYQSN